MTNWLSLTDEDRRISLEQANIRTGIRIQAIEKDWWVTLVLKALFELTLAEHFIFKGGTSLSKGSKLINRFSEDLDIALAPEAFGLSYRPIASKNYVEKVRKAGCTFTSTILKNTLEEKLKSFNLHGKPISVLAEKIPVDRPDKDPQIIYVYYPSLFEPLPYLDPRVKIEFSVRSLKEPYGSIRVQTILSEVFPQAAYPEEPFEVSATLPHKTYLEKIFLLLEKYKVMDPGDKLERQSRHLYDIVQMTDKGVLQAALNDKNLYHTLISHRKNWIRLKFDYDKDLNASSINLMPPEHLLSYFREDYGSMSEIFIYHDAPEFNYILDQLRIVTSSFNEWGK